MAQKQEQPEAPSAEQLHGEQLERGLDQLKSGGKWIIVVGIGFAAAAIGYAMWSKSTSTKTNEASLDLLSARSVEQLQAVITNHADSKPAALAQMQLGTQQFQADEYEQALSTYQTFLEKYAEHDLIPFADFGRVKCLEALERFEEAKAGYTALTTHASLKPLAQLGIARCLEQMNQLDEAVALYKELEETYADSAWADQARDFRELVEQELRKNS